MDSSVDACICCQAIANDWRSYGYASNELKRNKDLGHLQLLDTCLATLFMWLALPMFVHLIMSSSDVPTMCQKSRVMAGSMLSSPHLNYS